MVFIAFLGVSILLVRSFYEQEMQLNYVADTQTIIIICAIENFVYTPLGLGLITLEMLGKWFIALEIMVF